MLRIVSRLSEIGRNTRFVAWAPEERSTFGQESAATPLQKVVGHRSQVEEQQADGTRPADQALMATKPRRATRPAALCGVILRILTPSGPGYSASLTRRRRKALVITDTELKLIAAAAMIGESRMPNAG
jgi:hypothetical protein